MLSSLHMTITREEFLRLSELSCFSFSDADAKSILTDLNNTISYISKLSEVDTSDIEPTHQVFEMQNVWRLDKVIPQEATREDLLDLAPQTEDHQVKVPKVL